MLSDITFTLSMQASIFSCSTAFLAWEMLVVLLLDMPSFIPVLPANNHRVRVGVLLSQGNVGPSYFSYPPPPEASPSHPDLFF